MRWAVLACLHALAAGLRGSTSVEIDNNKVYLTLYDFGFEVRKGPRARAVPVSPDSIPRFGCVQANGTLFLDIKLDGSAGASVIDQVYIFGLTADQYNNVRARGGSGDTVMQFR